MGFVGKKLQKNTSKLNVFFFQKFINFFEEKIKKHSGKLTDSED